MKQTLLIMAKAPRPGHCKTRLCPPLSFEQAAELYRCFLQDTLANACRALAHTSVPTTLVLTHPQGDEDAMLRYLPPGTTLRVQPNGDLGARLTGLFAESLADVGDRVVIIGTDSPTMPGVFLHDAFAALETHDVTLGPARDGGYYLIGLKQLEPRLFTGVDWSTDRVYTQTLERARELSLRVHHLPVWHDVDTAADLDQLDCEIERSADAPHTAAFVRQRFRPAQSSEQKSRKPRSVRNRP